MSQAAPRPPRVSRFGPPVTHSLPIATQLTPAAATTLIHSHASTNGVERSSAWSAAPAAAAATPAPQAAIPPVTIQTSIHTHTSVSHSFAPPYDTFMDDSFGSTATAATTASVRTALSAEAREALASALRRREEAEAEGVAAARMAGGGSGTRHSEQSEEEELAEARPSLSHPFTWGQSLDECGPSSLDTPLPPTNIGFKLLSLMGWKGHGHGVGRHEQGRAEPIRMDVESGAMGLGIGKRAEMDAASEEATAGRKATALEVQARESEEQRLTRESLAAQAARVATHTKEVISALHCEDCGKQYALATEYTAHLSSYDHTHTVRMKETRRAENARKLASLMQASAGSGGGAGGASVMTAAERRQAKEDARMEAQMKAANAAMQAAQAPPAAAAPAAAAAIHPPHQLQSSLHPHSYTSHPSQFGAPHPSNGWNVSAQPPPPPPPPAYPPNPPTHNAYATGPSPPAAGASSSAFSMSVSHPPAAKPVSMGFGVVKKPLGAFGGAPTPAAGLARPKFAFSAD